MKKTYYLLVTAVVMTVLAACEKNNGLPSTEPTDKKIVLKTAIENAVMVKSPALNTNGEGNFSEGDIYTLFVSNVENQYNSFDVTVGSTQLYWKDITIDTKEGKVDFSACYPKQKANNGEFTFNLSSTEDKDLLLANTKEVSTESENPINLRFKHAMHRLKIEYTAEEGINPNEIITKCTAKSTCKVNMKECTLDTQGALTAEFEERGKEVEFIVVPQQSSEVTLEVSVDNIKKSFTVNSLKPELEDLKSGMQLNIELTIKNGKIEIGNVSIEGWENQGTIGGEIII